MNQKIIDYLNQNKDQYTQESLIEQLKQAGYSENDIQEGVSDVYGDKSEKIETPTIDKKEFNFIKIYFYWVAGMTLVVYVSSSSFGLSDILSSLFFGISFGSIFFFIHGMIHAIRESEFIAYEKKSRTKEIDEKTIDYKNTPKNNNLIHLIYLGAAAVIGIIFAFTIDDFEQRPILLPFFIVSIIPGLMMIKKIWLWPIVLVLSCFISIFVRISYADGMPSAEELGFLFLMIIPIFLGLAASFLGVLVGIKARRIFDKKLDKSS